MPTLEWIGKNKVINHHQDVPFRVLDRKYSFNAEGQTDTDNNSKNMIIRGDNLEALKALLPQYEGKVKCIYIDPPYNTGSEGWIYNDNVNDPKIKKWLGEVVGKEGEDLSRHDKWLCMMYPRLKLLYKLLADDGFIFISMNFADESAYLRCMCDEIFGKNNFIGELTWESTTQPINSGTARFNLQQKTEPIYLYAKNKKEKQQFILQELESELKYPHQGVLGDCRFEIIEKSDSGDYSRPTMKFEILGQLPRKGKRWQIGKDVADYLLRNKRLEIVDGVVKKAIYPEDEIDKRKFLPFWSHFSASQVGSALNGKEILNTIMTEPIGFDTVKPPKLIEEFISHIDSNAIILDSFAGSGTTAHAVLSMNKQDGGNRQFILVELEEYADSITAERVKRVIQGYDFTGEKKTEIYSQKLTSKNLLDGEKFINEAEKIIVSESKNFNSISKPKIEDNHLKVIGTKKYTDKMDGTDGDFSFYDLGETLLLPNGNLNEAVSTDRMREYVYFMETKEPLNQMGDRDNPYYLGKANDTAYYFYYVQNQLTTLNREFLASIGVKADGYIIYADKNAMSIEEMRAYNIVFKKIPRDIAKL